MGDEMHIVKMQDSTDEEDDEEDNEEDGDTHHRPPPLHIHGYVKAKSYSSLLPSSNQRLKIMRHEEEDEQTKESDEEEIEIEVELQQISIVSPTLPSRASALSVSYDNNAGHADHHIGRSQL